MPVKAAVETQERRDLYNSLCPWTLRVLVLLPALLIPTAAGALQAQKKVSTVEDARIYREAMVWFKKAEAMIGTPKENSTEQAELFQKALQIKPDFLEAHFDLGLIYANQKKMKDAVKEFETVLKLEPNFEPPNSADIHYLLASGYRDLGETDAAINALQQGLKRKPKDMQLLKALAYLQLGRTDENAAADTLRKILDITPTDVEARINLALLLQKGNETEEATANYRDALKVDANNFVAHYNLALIYLQQRNNSQAVEELEAANKINPDNGEVLERLGDAYAFQKLHQKAAAAYQAALAKAPNRSAILSKLGFSLASLNRTSEAISALEGSIRLNPQNADAYFLLGDLYSDAKRNEEAIAAYGNSLKLNSKQKEVHYNLGTLYAEQKQFQEAVVELKTAVEIDPAYAAAWSNLALVAEHLGMDKEAIEAHEKVIALGKGQGQNFFRLGLLYLKGNQPDSAIAAFGKAIELEPDKYRHVLNEELKKVHSVLDPIRYQERFTKLLRPPQ